MDVAGDCVLPHILVEDLVMVATLMVAKLILVVLSWIIYVHVADVMGTHVGIGVVLVVVDQVVKACNTTAKTVLLVIDGKPIAIVLQKLVVSVAEKWVKISGVT